MIGRRSRARAEAKDRHVSQVVADLLGCADDLARDIARLRGELRRVNRRGRR